MPKPKRPEPLNTAECARRTGLTVRALRVYERHGLIKPDDGLWAYFGAAQEASPWHQALRQTTDEAAKLVDSKLDPSSAPAMGLGHRLARICADHSLGDPLVYARWAGAMQFRGSADENARRKSTWEYLASALQAHAPHAPHAP
jgi:hypothetical protein